MPCCFDALSNKLIEQGVIHLHLCPDSRVRYTLGAPDLGLMSYGEVVDHVRCIASAINIPVIADGDTGYGKRG